MTSSEHDRPDYLFVRSRRLEGKGPKGFLLAGTLMTSIPRDREPTAHELAEIKELIGQIAESIGNETGVDVWRDRSRRPAGPRRKYEEDDALMTDWRASSWQFDVRVPHPKRQA